MVFFVLIFWNDFLDNCVFLLVFDFVSVIKGRDNCMLSIFLSY